MALVAAGLVALSGLYWFLVINPSPAGKKPLRVGHLVADELHQPGWSVAQELGFMSDEGFEPVNMEYMHGPAEMEHFAAGELDVAYVGAAPFLTARAAGVDIVAVASSNTEGSSVVAAYEIRDVADLNGKKVGSPGIGTIQDYMLTRVEENYGVSFAHFYAKITDLILYFERGEIDAYIGWEPHPTRAVVEGIRGAHMLLTSHDILPGHQCCVLAVRGDLMRDSPEVVAAVVRWHTRAQRWVLDHPEAAEEVIARYSGLSVNLIHAAHPVVQHNYPPYADLLSMRIILQGLISSGKIDPADVPNVDSFLEHAVDNTFVASLVQTQRRDLGFTFHLHLTASLPLSHWLHGTSRLSRSQGRRV
ncbi:MAG: ABC transporter substrate-binding protein [Aigarchaeota archaeon]|nr:ABC transporter substrate-binding protein [Aigarchaeota archaeon]